MNYIAKYIADDDRELEQSTRFVKIDNKSIAVAAITTYLNNIGFVESFDTKLIVDGDGDPIPLYTKPLIDYLNDLDMLNYSVLEFGAGNSTIYWSKKCKQVRSLETHPDYYKQLKESCGENVNISLSQNEEFYTFSDFSKYDIIVIDSDNNRCKIANNIVNRNVTGKIIIVDNSDWYRNITDLLKTIGYKEIQFFGFKNSQHWISCSSIFVDSSSINMLNTNRSICDKAFTRKVEHRWDNPEVD